VQMFGSSSAFHPRERRLRLRQLKSHLYGVVLGDGSQRLGACWRPLFLLTVQHPEIVVTVRLVVDACQVR
jgi:hypothetical protein